MVESTSGADAENMVGHDSDNQQYILRLDSDFVNIKATTSEGLGAIGRGQGIAAMAVVVLIEKT